MPAPTATGLDRLNSADETSAAAVLGEVCAARAWIRAVLAGRPYADTASLLTASDEATGALDADGLAEAMAGHPPIGRPKPGEARSAREQRGMTDASAALKAEMLELNLAYQERFGHVFLICATGLTGERMRDEAAARLGNTPDREREIVRVELGKINRVRLSRLAEGDAS